jgi:hypothetical protein
MAIQSRFRKGDSAMTVMLGIGDGTFQAAIPAIRAFPDSIFPEDRGFQRGRNTDLVSASVVVGEISVPQRRRHFQQPHNTLAGWVWWVRGADFTGDGKLTLLPRGCRFSGQRRRYVQAATSRISGSPGLCASDDLNGDGVQDLELATWLRHLCLVGQWRRNFLLPGYSRSYLNGCSVRRL